MKKILIIFPYDWLSYFSTALNLYQLLSEEYEVDIVTFASQNQIEDPNIHYVKVPQIVVRVVGRLDGLLLRFKVSSKLLFWTQVFWLMQRAIRVKPDEIVAGEFLGLWIAQLVADKIHLLVVDIDEDDVFYQRTNHQKIQTVLISNEERYKYLFPNIDLTRFYIPNSPIYRPLQRPKEKRGFVYCGSSIPQWGIFEYLEFISNYPKYTLTIRGGMSKEVEAKILERYQFLIDTGRVVINKTYIDGKDICGFVQNFRIGFCLYNVTSIPKNKRFNQLYGSYGKLFTYYASGVPVIATNIPGMQSVLEFNTGVLVEDMSPASIKNAVDAIEANYDTMCENCLRAAAHFSFDKAVQPFLDYIRCEA